jgi:Cyclin, N-terminal domain
MKMNIIESEIFDSDDKSYDDALDCLSVMIEQDTKSYRVRDYLNRRRKRAFRSATRLPDNEVVVDPAFRGKMCEWSYRLCDHFGTNREIVSFAFSFLDRFIDQINCDRSGFKLAAMTSMFIATKMMNVKGLHIDTLVTLCRGEFQVHHFLQMERIILSTLQFRLNPPITQAFVLQLCHFIPTMDEAAASEIFSRAIFYGELSVYDYKFVPLSNCQVAIACILNAMLDCEDDVAMSEILQATFITTLYARAGIKANFKILKDIQDRLWYLYCCSSESKFENQSRSFKSPVNHKRERIDSSPVSVTGLKRINPARLNLFSAQLLS